MREFLKQPTGWLAITITTKLATILALCWVAKKTATQPILLIQKIGLILKLDGHTLRSKSEL
ncbi:MAG: hypothetical protein CG439_2073, partial [Methylococcaceae bacterium NSP1-2]